jgi:hypothetical protein
MRPGFGRAGCVAWRVSLSGTGGQLPQGAPGKVDLVTCKAVMKRVHGKKVTKQHCTTRLTSSPERFRQASPARPCCELTACTRPAGSETAGSCYARPSR